MGIQPRRGLGRQHVSASAYLPIMVSASMRNAAAQATRAAVRSSA